MNQLLGAIEWTRHGRKTVSSDAHWTCTCSTNTLSEKHITPNPHSTRQRWHRPIPKRQSPTLETGIIVFQSEKKTDTSLRSSHHGVGTGTKLVHRATLRPKMGTLGDSTRSSMNSPTRPSASTMLAYGQTHSKKISSKHVAGCGRYGIVQNPEKFIFGSDTVESAGFVITPTDIQPSDKHIRVIRDFPTPQNITDIRSWFSLVNQVSYPVFSGRALHRLSQT